MEERDIGGGDAEAAEEWHAHGLLHPGEAERGQRPHRLPDQHVLGEGQSLLGDHRGDVRLVAGGRGGGEEEEGEKEGKGMETGHGGWRRGGEADSGRKRRLVVQVESRRRLCVFFLMYLEFWILCIFKYTEY